MTPTPVSTKTSADHLRSAVLVVLLIAVVLATTACPGNVSQSYRTFKSAVDRGASCSELFDQRAGFEDDDTLSKVNGELDRIGCTSPTATRTDR